MFSWTVLQLLLYEHFGDYRRRSLINDLDFFTRAVGLLLTSRSLRLLLLCHVVTRTLGSL